MITFPPPPQWTLAGAKDLAHLFVTPSRWETAHLDADRLLDPTIAFYVLPCYVAFVLLLKAYMHPKRPKFNVKPIMVVHNLFLCLLSLAMCLGALYAVATGGHSMLAQYCDTKGSVFTGQLWWWSFVFYASKYYELLDTPLLILAQRPLTFLHVWHHSSIAVLCLAFMRAQYNFFWSGVAINAGIHTFMYYYYFMAALGRTPKWKRAMTTGQIVQFVWGISSFWGFFAACPAEAVTPPARSVWFLNQGILISCVLPRGGGLFGWGFCLCFVFLFLFFFVFFANVGALFFFFFFFLFFRRSP
jgi:hypothetical protein